MFLERIRPTGPLDELLADALIRRDAEAVVTARAILDDTVIHLLERAVAGTCEPDEARHLARQLSDHNLPAAAVAAFTEALTFKSAMAASFDSARRADIHAEAAAFKHALGATFSAQAHVRAARRLQGEDNSRDTLPELDGDGLMVLSAFNDSDGHLQRLGDLPFPALGDDPSRDPGFSKQMFLSGSDGEQGEAAEDYSFFVIDDRDGAPVLLVECDALGDRFLGCREAGIDLTVIQPDHPGLEAARSLALRQLDLITGWAGCPRALLDIPADTVSPPSLVAHLGDPRSWSVILIRLGWIDLVQDEAAIRAGYRASTRQRVRWGVENLDIRGDRDPALDIPALHAALKIKAGREGGIGYEQLAAGLADGTVNAVVGFHQGEVASMVLTSRHGNVCYDMATVRIAGDGAPLSHALIDTAIAEAKARGQKRFHFGPLYGGGEFGAKLKSIAEFKSGFASAFERRLLVWMPPR